MRLLLIMLAILSLVLLLASTKPLNIYTTPTIREVIKSGKPLLFLADWENCTECDELEEKFVERIKNYNGELTFGKMNIDDNQEIPLEFKFYSAPRFVLFYAGAGVQISKPTDLEFAIEWAEKKISGNFQKIEKSTEFEALSKQPAISIIMVADPSDLDAQAFLKKLWVNSDSSNYYYYPTKELMIEGKSIQLPVLAIARNFDTPALLYKADEWNSTIAEKFVIESKVPLCGDFSDSILSHIYENRRNAFILYMPKNNEDKEIVSIFKEAAKKYYPDLMFVKSDIETKMEISFAGFLGIQEENMPTIATISRIESGHPTRYRMTEKITKESLEKFIEDFNKNNLVENGKSEKEPVENKQSLRKLVADTFTSVVKNGKYDYVILLCKTKCNESKLLLNEIAENLVPLNKDLKFGYMDMNRNDLKAFKLESDSLYFSTKRSKQTEFIKMKENLEEDSIVSFIEENISGILKLKENAKPKIDL
jgi:hypothetical protein